MNALQSPKDPKTVKNRDQRGQIEEEIDPDGNTTTREFNAFKQVKAETLPLETKEPTLKILHEFDPRGLEVKTTKIAADGTEIITSAEYKNPLGKMTKFTDGENNTRSQTHDRVGGLESKIGGNGKTTDTYKRDMKGREIAHTDGVGNTKTRSYNQSKRTETLLLPDKKSYKTLTKNGFKEVIASENDYGNDEWTHAPDGQIATHTDALKNTEKNSINLIGQKTTHQDYEGILTDTQFDLSGNPEQITEDTAGLKRTHTKLHDALNNIETEINPNHVTTENEFTLSGLLTKKTQDTGSDPDSLNLTTANQYNAQNNLTYFMKGDAKNPNQTDTQILMDGFSRKTGTVIDPKGLALKNSLILDKANRVIVKIDANNNPHYQFYDSNYNLRFEITPLGGVTEYRYDDANRKVLNQQYEKSIDIKAINEKTPLSSVESLVAAIKDPLDSPTYFVYDPNFTRKPQFEVNGVGTIREYVYDNAGRKKAEILHDHAFLKSDLSTINRKKILNSLATKITPITEFDRVTYWIYDAAGHERFLIDPEGYVTEQRYDKNHRTTMSIRYDTKVPNPQELSSLSAEDFLSHILLTPENDRYNYTYFTSLGQPEILISPKGYVTRFHHDAAGNVIQITEFKKQVTMPGDYETLRTEIAAWTPNNIIDSVYIKKYDHANRLTDKFDPFDNVDHFELDGLGNATSHKDRATFVWKKLYDRASRCYQSIKPETEITIVKISPENGELVEEKQRVELIDETIYDCNGNKKRVTHAKGTTEERILNSNFNACNSFTGIQLDNIPIDDPLKPANLSEFPVRFATLTTEKIFNAKQKVISERVLSNKDGKTTLPWKFYVYDCAQRLIYKVQPDGTVIHYDRNTFGDIRVQTQYDQRLTIDLSPYVQTGIPLSVISANLKPSPDDRTTTNSYDRKGQKIKVSLDEIYFHVCNGKNQYNPATGTKASPTKTIQYNGFSEPTLVSNLIDSVADTWQKDLFLYDREGNREIKAHLADEIQGFFVTWESFNRNKKVVDSISYALPLNETLTPESSIKAIKIKLDSQKPYQNRQFHNEYDLRGDLTSHSSINVMRDALHLGDKNKPRFESALNLTVTELYGYDPRQSQTSLTRPDGLSAYTFFNEVNKKSAETGFTAATKLNPTQEDFVTPLTYLGCNALLENVSTTEFINGTTPVIPGQYPKPLYPDNAANKKTLRLKDKRGFTQIVKKPESSGDPAKSRWTVYTSTPSKKIARDFYAFQNNDGSKTFEHRYLYDIRDRLELKDTLENSNVTESSENLYNSFSETIGEGPGNHVFPRQRKFDKAGNMWFSNEKVPTAFLTDLRGKTSIRIQSAYNDLSKAPYEELQPIIADPNPDYDKTESQLDNRGAKIALYQPEILLPSDDSPGTDIPHSVLVGNGFEGLFKKGTPCLTWAPLTKVGLKPTFYLDKERLILDTVTGPSRSGVDLSQIPAGIHTFEIEFALDGAQGTGINLFKASGNFEVATSVNSPNSYSYEVFKDNQLTFNNNFPGVNSIELWLGEAKIGSIPVKPGTQTLDLSQYASGNYTVVVNGERSLPFTIYTKKPNSTVLSWDIPFSINIHCVKQYGQIFWTVPELFYSNNLKVECQFETTGNKSKTITQEIPANFFTPSKPEKPGDPVIYYNFDFKNEVSKIQKISVSLKNFDGQWIPLSQEDVPLKTSTPDDYQFTNRRFFYVYPWKNDGEQPSLYFKDMRNDINSNWTKISKPNFTDQGVSFEMGDFPLGVYPLQIKNLNGSTNPDLEHVFTVSNDGTNSGMLYVSDHYLSPSTGAQKFSERVKNKIRDLDTAFRPSFLFTQDHWGNVTQKVQVGQKTSLITDTTFNDKNQKITVTLPETTSVDEKSNSTRVRPATTRHVNIQNQSIGYTDPKSSNFAFILNEAGTQLQSILPTGETSFIQELDGFFRPVKYWDSRNHLWQQQFNNSDLITQMTKPSGLEANFIYNARDFLLAQLSPSGNNYYYNYSAKGDIISRKDPSGLQTTMTWNRNHQMSTLQNGAGELTWNYDFEGNYAQGIAGHTDLAEAATYYTLNYKMQPIRITSQGGNFNRGYYITPIPVFYVVGKSLRKAYIAGASIYFPNQDLQMTYQGDKLSQVLDRGNNTQTDLVNDDFLNPHIKTFKNLTSGGIHVSIQENDELFRPESVTDGALFLTNAYDVASNRRNVKANIDNVENWFDTDSCGRVTKDACAFVNGQIQPVAGQGVVPTYLNNYRATEYFIDTNKNSQTVTLAYYPDNQLNTTSSDNGFKTTRQYDGDGENTFYLQQDNDNNVLLNQTAYTRGIVTGLSSVKGDTANPFSLTWAETQIIPGTNNVPSTENTNYYANLEYQWNLNTAFYYARFDELMLFAATSQINTRHGEHGFGIALQGYNANGHLVAVVNTQPSSDNSSESATFFLIPSYDGRVLESYEVITSEPGKYDEYTQVKHHFYYYNLKGQYQGTYTIDETTQLNPLSGKPSNALDSFTPSNINFSRFGVNSKGGTAVGFNADQGAWEFRSGKSTFCLEDYFQPIATDWGNGSSPIVAGGNLFRSSAKAITKVNDWKNFQSVQTTFPPLTTDNYTVQIGDTLGIVSDKEFGNSNEEAMIAMNNGMTPGASLGAGKNLLIPQYIPMTNTATDSLPFIKFQSLMIPQLQPFVKIDSQSDIWEMVVEIVAVVVGAIALPELAPTFFAAGVAALTATGLATIVATSAIAAVAAGLVDAIGQGILIATGVEKEFHPAYVLEAAVSAAGSVKGGLTSGINVAHHEILTAALRAGATNLAMAFAELAVGTIDHIDLLQIVGSMAGAAAGATIFPALGTGQLSGAAEAGETAENAVVDGFVEAAIQGEPVNIDGIFENVLVSEAGDALSSGRKALAQADNVKQTAGANIAKIPGPADTGLGWQNAGNNAISAANDPFLGSSASASVVVNSVNDNSRTQSSFPASDPKWMNAGSAAIAQKSQATNHMLNQMHQVLAQSDMEYVNGDELFNLYSAQVGAYSEFSEQNSENSSWQNVARNSISSGNSEYSEPWIRSAWDFGSNAVTSFAKSTAMGIWNTVTHPEILIKDARSMLNNAESLAGYNGFDAMSEELLSGTARIYSVKNKVENGAQGIEQDLNSNNWSSLGTKVGLFAAAVNPFGGEFKDVELAEDLGNAVRVEQGLSSGTERFTLLADNLAKSEARTILRDSSLELPDAQRLKALKQLGSGKMDQVSIKLMKNGELRLSAVRTGAVNGFQRMSFGIDNAGNTNKVVQTAFDDMGNLVHQNPGELKNNLYDVKKWNN